jgi:hypothetical protein
VNPDEHLARQAEAVRKYSVRSLQEQLQELRREERVISKEQRLSDKDTRVRQAQWEQLIGLSTVAESRSELPVDDSLFEGMEAPLRHALALDDEVDTATQTDASLALQHPVRPRVVRAAEARAEQQRRAKEQQSALERIHAEVAAEFASKAMGGATPVALGAEEMKQPAASSSMLKKKPATGGLPAFQSVEDQYRAQLRQQYQLVLDAQRQQATGSAEASTKSDSTPAQAASAGALVEARLRRLREDTLNAANPLRLLHMRQAEARARRDKEARTAFGEGEAGEKEQDEKALLNDEQLWSSAPDAVIGSRTAALLFEDPAMMRLLGSRRQQQQQGSGGTATSALDPVVASMQPSPVAEVAAKTKASVEAQLGVQIPGPSFVPGAPTRALSIPAVRPPLDQPESELLPVQRAVQSWSAEAEAIFRPDEGDQMSDLDRQALFGPNRRPIHAVRNEAEELDADVRRLEDTIRALHREFGGPSTAVEPLPPGSHPLVPELESSLSGSARRPPMTAQQLRERAEDDRRMAAAQAYVDEMDAVLGLPPRTTSIGMRQPSTSGDRSRTADGGLRSPSHRSVGSEQSHQQQQQHPSPSSSNPATSRLVYALEKYLSLDVPALDALLGPARATSKATAAEYAAMALPPPTAEAASFTAHNDVHRPSADFLPYDLSPAGKAAAAAATAASAAKSASNAKPSQPQLQSHRPPHHPHVSWDSHSNARGSDSLEEEHMQALLRDNAEDVRMQPRSPSSSSGGAHRHGRTSSGGGGATSSLSRVSENEHEYSRSSSNGSRQHPVSARQRILGSPPADSYESSADDAALGWQDSSADHSMIMHVAAPHDAAGYRSPPPPSSAHRHGGGIGIDVNASPRGAGRPRAILSPSAAQQRKSPRTHADAANSSLRSPRALGEPNIQPRSNNATELRRAQQQQDQIIRQQRLQGAISPYASRPGSAQQRSPRPATTAAVGSAVQQHQPVLPAKPMTAMERERERRRQKQLHAGAPIMRSSRDLTSPKAAGGRVGTSSQHHPQLSASNDRLMRDAQALMADFRAQMDAMPLLPSEQESGGGGDGHSTARSSGDFDSARRSAELHQPQWPQQQQHQPNQYSHHPSVSPHDLSHHPDEFRPDAHAATWRRQLSEGSAGSSSSFGDGQGGGVGDSYASAASTGAPPVAVRESWYGAPTATSWNSHGGGGGDDDDDPLAETDEDRLRAAQPPPPNPLDDSDDELFR